MKDEFKIGIVGLGLIAIDHITAINRVDGLRLTAICDTDPDKLKKFSQNSNVAAFDDYHKMLDTHIDGVVITLPHYLHAKVSMEALQKGLNVLVEKPVAITDDELLAIEEQAFAAGKVLLGADTAYFDSRFILARAMTEEIDTGKFLFGTYMNHRDYMDPQRPAWFFDPDKSGGGQFMNIGVHRIAAVRRILGDSRKVLDVASSMQSTYDSKVETATQLFVKYDDGATFFYEECGFPPVSDAVSQKLHLVFEKGILNVELEYVEFRGPKCSVKTPVSKLSSMEMYCALYRNFLAALRGEKVYPDFSHNAADVRLVLQSIMSSR